MRRTSHRLQPTISSGLSDRAVPSPRARRWAELLCAAAGLAEDPRTLGEWANAVNLSEPTLRTRCYLAGVSPRRSLLLARLLRAVRLAPDLGCVPCDLLDAKDPRTLKRLLAIGGLTAETVAETCSALTGC
jgi:AraC-like DNA-binding protein